MIKLAKFLESAIELIGEEAAWKLYELLESSRKAALTAGRGSFC